MPESLIGGLVGMGAITVVNIVTVAYFYGRLCGKVEANTWKIERLWKKVFNGRDK